MDTTVIDERAVSRIPYPSLDQVEQSVAIQRLRWARQLPYPRTHAEHGVYIAIVSRGWYAPED